MIGRMLLRTLRETVTWALILLLSFPLLWMVLTALKPKDETTSFPPAFWPEHWTLEHFRTLLFHSPFLRYFANSLVVATATTLLCVVFAVLGAHALTRYRFPGRRLVARVVLFT
jgi:multiple sugar transport system permease protein